MSPDLCRAKAEECELRARDAPAARAQEWLVMACEWRMAGAANDHDALVAEDDEEAVLDTEPVNLWPLSRALGSLQKRARTGNRER
jgi:hypothetical protein